MYGRIYIPEKYRFFFPPADVYFYLIKNIRQIETHIATSGYFIKGVRSWVEINGPLEPVGKIHVTIIDDNRNAYEMNVDSGNKISIN